MKKGFAKWDVQHQLTTERQRRAFLKAAFEQHADNPEFLVQCIGEVARARGMARIAKETGLGRESLYKALSGKGNPSFATVMRVTEALGVQLQPR